ncbi:MAG: aminotransferase class V-fold PLP-dependent enzyme [Gammaproteobacteria bacterium]|nr:aminotransferase class V-fold PLP-dependent enzyme [Gammaproteobacteria bacterium]
MNSEFSLSEDIIYLNHAAVAPWPARTARAVEAFARENVRYGAAHYPRWLEVESSLRKRMAKLINSPSTADIAILKSTSEALSVVAHGIDWRPGDNLVIFAQEFPSNRLVWEALKPRGVEVRLIDLQADQHPEQRMIAACDARTRLVSVSSVQYASGFRTDLEPIGAHCRQRGILYCIDAIQSLGAIPFDVQHYRADFVMADGHKWMLGPEGCALFYSREEARDRLTLHQHGWRMVARPGDYDDTSWSLSPTATRFECGSPNMLGIHALDASLSLLLEIGIDRVHGALMERSDYLLELFERHAQRIRVLSSCEQRRRSGIVTFRLEGGEPQDSVYRRLMSAGVVCASRGGGVRFSPHFYTPLSDLDRAVEKLLSI